MPARLQVTIIGGRNLAAKDLSGTSDPYVKLKWSGQEYKTDKVKKSLNPSWNESFLLNWEPTAQNPPLTFEVYDWDRFSKDDFMGSVALQMPPNMQIGGAPMEGWYDLQNGGKGQIGLKFQLFPGHGGQQQQGGSRPYQAQQIVTINGPPMQQMGGGGGFPSYPAQQPSYPAQQQQQPPLGGGAYPQLGPPPSYTNAPPAYSQSPPPPAYAGGGGGGGGGRGNTVQEIMSILPHVNRQQVESALQRHNGNKDAAVDELLGGGGGQQPKKVEPNPRYLKDIKEILPHCSYEDIAKALVKWDNDKEKALDELIKQQITVAADQSPHHSQQQSYHPTQGTQSHPYQSWYSVQQQGTSQQQTHPFTHPGVTQASSIGGAPTQPTGRKKALLIGINYTGTRAELRGCINDVRNMRRVLTGIYGFPDTPETMVVLTDDSNDRRFLPTRANILTACRWLALNAQPGDALFFHFSGHGAQQVDPSGREEDGMDETILPMDYQRAGQIVDDELHNLIVHPLPSGCRLTAVMDCCHSGTGLDLPYTWEPRRGGWVEDDNPSHTMGDVQLFSGCEDAQTSADAGGTLFAPHAAGGAMTSAFIAALTQNPFGHTYPSLLQALHTNLRHRGFQQRPQLTSTQRFQFQRAFDFTSSVPNSNQYIGRVTRKRKKPKRPLMGMGGQGGMGGVGNMALGALGGFMVGNMLGDLLFD